MQKGKRAQVATRVMLTWILILLVGWAGVFGFFAKHFDGVEFEKRKVAALQNRLHTNLRQIARLQLNFSEYKDAIAAAGVKVPEKGGWTDSKRMIASVMADPEYKKIPQIQPGVLALTSAKKIFAAGDFFRATELLDDFMQKYPDSPYLPEAAYLLSESYFAVEQLEASTKMIDFVLTHFPETEYACYGLLRMGKIFEKQERLEEASDTYKLGLTNFPKSNCASMAEKNLKELNL